VSYPGFAAIELTDRMKEMVGLSSSPSAVVKKHADINIFTVASGLLYEVSYRSQGACGDKLKLSDSPLS
jgi:hypothetical protein